MSNVNWNELIDNSFTKKKDVIEKSMKRNQNDFIVKVGKNVKKLNVRFLLNRHRKGVEEVPYYTVFYHYGIRPYGLVCLHRTFGQPCHICKVIESMQKDLKSRGITEGEEFKQIAKWYANPLYYMAVFVRGLTENNVRYLELNEKMRTYVLNKMFKNPTIWHPVEGKDFVLEFKTDGKKFGEKTIEIDDEKSVLFPDDSNNLKVIEAVEDFWKLFKYNTYDEVKKEFELFLSEMGMNEESTADTPDVQENHESPTEQVIKKEEDKKKDNTADDDAVLKELFGS